MSSSRKLLRRLYSRQTTNQGHELYLFGLGLGCWAIVLIQVCIVACVLNLFAARIQHTRRVSQGTLLTLLWVEMGILTFVFLSSISSTAFLGLICTVSLIKQGSLIAIRETRIGLATQDSSDYYTVCDDASEYSPFSLFSSTLFFVE